MRVEDTTRFRRTGPDRAPARDQPFARPLELRPLLIPSLRRFDQRPGDFFQVALGLEETLRQTLDQRGRWLIRRGEPRRRDRLPSSRIPLQGLTVDRFERSRCASRARAASRPGPGPRWPGRHRFSTALAWNLDRRSVKLRAACLYSQGGRFGARWRTYLDEGAWLMRLPPHELVRMGGGSGPLLSMRTV